MVINLTSRKKDSFCTNVRFVEGKCKLWLWRALISWISELDIKQLLFFLTKTSNEKIYWDGSGSICNFLYKSQHESCLPEFVITLIVLFWICARQCHDNFSISYWIALKVVKFLSTHSSRNSGLTCRCQVRKTNDWTQASLSHRNNMCVCVM